MAIDLSDVKTRRRLYITLALKRARPGSGSSLATLRARTWRQTVFNLGSFVTVPFVVVGAVATRLYAPKRTTDDLNILVRSDDAPQLYHDLGVAGGNESATLRSAGVNGACRMGQHWTCWNRMPSGRVTRSSRSSPVPKGCRSSVCRGIDIGDLTRMSGGADAEALDSVRAVIDTYLNDAAEDLEYLVSLGRLEYEQGQPRDKG